ncbi:hypothetical protein C0W38_09825 [Photobacterium angustum]|nr:hypothetical protein UA33_06395 [Photobacterium angustum]KJG24814.1 hypothetical protein UA39_05950 [Photobacterium angustum]KJG33054.1 hypothetical protein UA36_06385 [Photobacterium angustum]PSW97683.1 hypothetical protein C0W79_05440 [Photobacterium angustum]PSX01584.1 hypothetical protein C0W87_13525 [Photobacterium angustum]
MSVPLLHNNTSYFTKVGKSDASRVFESELVNEDFKIGIIDDGELRVKNVKLAVKKNYVISVVILTC